MPNFFSRFLPLVIGCLVANLLNGQDVVRISQGSAMTCDATFFDSGGPNGNHTGAGTFQEITICSDMPGTANSQIRVSFQSFVIDGVMTIHDGPNTMAPVYASIDSDVEDRRFNGPFVVQARAGNTSGCLTFVFESRGTAVGWAGTVGCERRCQEVIAELVTTTPAAQPDAAGYIDVCPGDEITFTGRGNYTETGIPGAYPQQDALSIFTWNFQDGTVLSGRGLTTVSHAFENPGGYIIQLDIEDEEGCNNLNRISQRVRVAPPPVFMPPSNLPESICTGESVTLTVGREESTFDVNFNPTPIEFSFVTSQTFSELTELPDNTIDIFSSPLEFTNFLPGQLLGQSSDLVKICASMEHSYLGDLDIWITCPDGSRVDLHRYNANDDVQRQLLGQGDQFTITPDPPGTYCWTATAPRTMARHISRFNLGDNVTMPEIDYAPEESLDAFVGCPLNGEWTMNIRDNLSNDNGFIYEWSIEFASSLYPEQETFVVAVDNFMFEDFNNFSFYGRDSAIFSPPNPGPNVIKIISTDDYGCIYDTSVVIQVLPPYSSECFNCEPLLSRTQLDTSICQGEEFQPNLSGGIETDTLITFESFVQAPFSNALYPNAAAQFENVITIEDFLPARLVDPLTDLESVCVSLENNGDLDDITIQVMSPNGRTLTLLENFGSTGEDLVQTCFSPTSTDAMSTGTAPYTGTFQSSDDNWSTFNNVRINGDWKLVAFDDQGNDLGELVSWSVTLRYDREFTYAWTPDDGSFSCTDCPNPTITPVAAGTYTLDVMTAAGCTAQAMVNVTFNILDITVTETLTNPNCPGTTTGAIDLDVTGSDPSYNYTWSDGGPATQDRANLPAGMYTVSVSDANGCEETFDYELVERAPLQVTIDDVVDATCFNATNGEIRVTTSGGTPPYTFLWNDSNAQNEEDAGSLSGGTYELLVTDAANCALTFTATVNQPDELEVTFRTGIIACRGGTDGYAVAVATGGNGDYTYDWQTGSDQDSIFGLGAGSYDVIVTDRLNCTTTATVNLTEPAVSLTATVVQDEQGCFNAFANAATVTPSGGSPGYTFLWSNGETVQTATALPAGENTVAVTDDNGCTQIFMIMLQELPELTVNVIATVPTCNDRADGRLGAVPTGGAGTIATDYTYAWSNNRTEVAILDLPGNLNYRVTVTGPRGCTGIGERFLNSPPPITFGVDETPVNCFGESNGGLSIVNIDGPNPGNFALQWSAEANGAITPVISGLPAGTAYGLRITDAIGCTIDTTLRITEPPAVVTAINQVDVSCFGETDGRITATGSGGVGGFRYEWNTGSTQNQIAALPSSTYIVTLSDANGCEDINTVEVVQPDAVTIMATGTAAICQGEATGMVDVIGGGGRPPYLYGLEGQGLTRNPTFIGLRQGDYVALVRDSAGCQISLPVVVGDGPVFSLELPEDRDIVFGDSLTLESEITGGIGTITYRWIGSYGGTLSCTDCPEPLAKPEYEIDYTLLVSDGNGCSDEQRIRVSVAKIREVRVPTGFTPNGDFMNDRLIVHGRPGTLVKNFTVFDRWANVLYEANDFAVNDVDSGWDGKSRDREVNAGVYFYKLVVEYDDGSNETLAGETTLIR